MLALLFTGFGKILVVRWYAWRLATGQWCVCDDAARTWRKYQALAPPWPAVDKNQMGPSKCDGRKVHPITFQVFLPLKDACYELFTRWTREINSKATAYQSPWTVRFLLLQLCAEFYRITNVNLKKRFYTELDRHSPRLEKMFRKRAARTGSMSSSLKQVFTTYDLQVRC